MKNRFKNINFPSKFKYSSDSEHIPLEFYNDTFPIAKKIDLFLGYFSSNAIKVLSKSFAEFVVNGGEMRIITNHVYSLKDKENLIDHNALENEDKIIDIFNDLEKLEFELSDYGQHFFDCLKYLQKHKRLIIQPVKFNNVDLAHCKRMVLYDGHDYISTDGSINFTLSALTKNSESFEVNAPWKGDVFKERVDSERAIFEKVLSGQHPDYIHISSEKIEVVINNFGNDKNKQDLLEDSLKIDNSSFGDKVKRIIKKKKERFQKKLKLISSTPKFPYDEPREYQKEAYLAWVKNNYKGIFAMATGTGKTLTSLNCIVEEFKKTGEYSVIITVPTRTLVSQWEQEAGKFNLTNIITSANNRNWDKDLNRILFNKQYGIGENNNYVFITTYATFNKVKCQKLIKKINSGNTTLIADEAHNLGAATSLRNLPNGIKRRIGLSATPERIYDDEGSVKLYEFFNSFPPIYTYKFSMRQAIDEGFLTPYYYYPYFVNLDHDELEQYLEISRQLLRFFDFATGKFRDSATQLLIKRKRIVHKARNKKTCLEQIFREVKLKNESLKYTFVYVPEGYDRDNSEDCDSSIEEEDMRIINEYSKIINGFGYKTYQFLGETKNRDKVLNQFKNGELEILTAMKALDEGVDIPITKNAIFCASTGNPRQFIQRRGRVLRTFKGKDHANIYDMVVVPSIDLMSNADSELKDMEVRIFKGELKRVANFLYSSENMMEVINDKIRGVAEEYNLDIFELINENIENDKLK